MGTCYSNNDTKIRKVNSNKPKRTTSCLGSLCNDSANVEESQNKFQSQMVPNNIPKIKSTYNIYHKTDKLNNDLNELIEKYNYKLKIKKRNYVQLYNIFMNYIYDFTKSNFVICDTREELRERNQIFLKKFHQINYTLKEIETMTDERLIRFSNFLNNKNIIFILKDESSINILEQYIIFFIANINESHFMLKNIYILSEYIKEYNKDNISNIAYLENLYYFIDEDIIYNYSPKILINSNDIKSSSLNYNNPNSNNAYVFINKYSHAANINQDKKDNNNKIINKFDINYICNKNTEEPDTFLNFVSKFNIYYILNFILLNEDINKKNIKYITHSEAKRNKVEKEEKKSLIKQKNVSIPKNMAFEEFYKIIKNEFLSILEEFKNQIEENNCVLIQFDDSIDISLKYKLIYIIIFRLTGLTFDEIFNYLICNFYDIENELLCESKKEEIINLLV